MTKGIKGCVEKKTNNTLENFGKLDQLQSTPQMQRKLRHRFNKEQACLPMKG